MSKSKKIYGLAGVNGYGIYDDYNKLCADRVFVKKSQIKKFSDFNQAREWALDMFWELQNVNDLGMVTESIQKINWVYYIKRH